MTRSLLPPLLMALLLAACSDGERGGSVSCGLAAMNGPLVALEGFAQGRGLAAAPSSLPDTLPGRYVAGPSAPVSIITDSTGSITARISAAPPERSAPGFGVLIMDKSRAMGVLIHDGAPVPGAVTIGSLLVGESTLPLYGVRVVRSMVETEQCPLFPATTSPSP